MRVPFFVLITDDVEYGDSISKSVCFLVRKPSHQMVAERPQKGDVIFERRNPREIFPSGERLDEHLKAMGTGGALRIRELLQAQCWDDFEQQYRPGERRPYAPEAMLSLILYGILKGISSLRGLEGLARIDLGCMWITGGLCPDHASIGRFIQMHDGQITGEFPGGLTRSVQVTQSGVDILAGDGTVVQAAASRYHTIMLEVARQAADSSRQ